MNEELVAPAAYVHRLGVDEVPEWLPSLHPSVLEAADAVDATRGADGYGAASVEYAVNHPDDRPRVILWALLRYRLDQPDAARLLDAALLEDVRWKADEALWIGDTAPLTPHTAALIVRALEALWLHELPLAADRVEQLRRAELDAGLSTRVGWLQANIARVRKIGAGFDPRFADRVAIPLRRPIHALLFHCTRDKPGPPGLHWQWRMRELAGRNFDAVVEIVKAIPDHLEEHGRFSQGEDILRGLVVMAGHADEEWTVPLLASIIVAAAGTRPVLSQKLARTAVDALFLCTGAKETMRGLESRVRSEAIRKRVAESVQHMR
ncbi:hypothetical protein [Phytomonospora endophytica]|uniref:Uncharacterized protein n=1 Tax=Phytomonospora endophytica TaxID=714109 RepID=A0A841FA20_9ACTN|nr:hypothetical protein [Phytomonospora endophytica]MBB6033096.1 hypothetical protein [Phytomonospora endophytica]GIG65323.1 hypothetical protein Pen01_16180 [Phytomonospora endophytica]